MSEELKGDKAIKQIKEISNLIHYPECWDTVNYPTMIDAIREIGCNPDCCQLTQPEAL